MVLVVHVQVVYSRVTEVGDNDIVIDSFARPAPLMLRALSMPSRTACNAGAAAPLAAPHLSDALRQRLPHVAESPRDVVRLQLRVRGAQLVAVVLAKQHI